MAPRRDYRRYQVILQEEDSDYRMDPEKKPTGYVKIQVKGGKGVLNTFVQNLKYSEEGEWVYKGFLARIDRNPQVINTGTIVIDQKGRGQALWEFDADNVGGKGQGIDAYDVFGVMVHHRYRNSQFICPLVGYIGEEKRGWRDILLERISPRGETEREYASEKKAETAGEKGKEEKKRAPEYEMEAEKFTQKPGEEVTEGEVGTTYGMEEGGKEEGIEEDKEEREEEVKAGDGEEPSEAGREERAEQIPSERETTGKTHEEEAGRGQGQYKDTSGIEDYMENILKYYCKVQPFEYPVDRCRWWCINSYNYLFGIRYNQDNRIVYYIYGIPGPYDPYIEKQMNSCGFYNWRPIKGKEKKQGAYGYWLAFVDAKTGKIVDPEDL